MKREILFKAKRIDNGKWIKGSLVNNLWNYSGHSGFLKGTNVCEIITGKYEGDCWEDAIMDSNNIISVDPETICQYTGTSDHYGNKIFEGDILRHTVNVVDSPKFGKVYDNVVDYFMGGSYCGWRIGSGKFRKPLTENWIYNQKAQIVGNIHDKK